MMSVKSPPWPAPCWRTKCCVCMAAVKTDKMVRALTLKNSVLKPEFVFRLFKYTIYVLLAYNAFLFFGEDLAASAQTYGERLSWRNVIEAYSASIDTTAWVILLLLFELETAVIPDQLLKGPLKWVFNGLSAVVYFFIIYSFYG